MFRGNLPPSTWENLLPSKPGTSLLHFPIFLLLPLVKNLLPLDASSQVSSSYSTTPPNALFGTPTQATTTTPLASLIAGHTQFVLLLHLKPITLLNLHTPPSPHGILCKTSSPTLESITFTVHQAGVSHGWLQ